MAVGRFRSPVWRSGTRCLTSSEIRRVVLTVLSSFLRQSCSNVTSAGFLNVMRYINPRFTYLLMYTSLLHVSGSGRWELVYSRTWHRGPPLPWCPSCKWRNPLPVSFSQGASWRGIEPPTTLLAPLLIQFSPPKPGNSTPATINVTYRLHLCCRGEVCKSSPSIIRSWPPAKCEVSHSAPSVTDDPPSYSPSVTRITTQ